MLASIQAFSVGTVQSEGEKLNKVYYRHILRFSLYSTYKI